MRYTTDPGADTSAQDYLADQGDNGAAKELEGILKGFARAIMLQIPAKDTDTNYTLPTAIAALEHLIEQSNRLGRIKEWQRIYNHFASLDPSSIMPHTSPKESILIELKELQPALSTEEDTGVAVHNPKVQAAIDYIEQFKPEGGHK